jgi:hypothetical protein
MAEPIKVPYEETAESYVARIRELAGTDRVGGARRVLQEALQRFPDDPVLARWKELLGPAKFNGYRPASGLTRDAELRWLDTHGSAYRGEWLAVLGDQLLGHSKDLQELTEQLKGQPTEHPPLYHYIPETE